MNNPTTQHLKGGVTVSETCNRWPNYETSCVHAWLTKDESRFSYWRDQAREAQAQAHAEATQPGDDPAQYAAQLLAERIEEHFEETNPLDEDEPSVWTELLDAAQFEVNWFAIAQAFLDSRCAGGR
jgi:hypothetical protein